MGYSVRRAKLAAKARRKAFELRDQAAYRGWLDSKRAALFEQGMAIVRNRLIISSPTASLPEKLQAMVDNVVAINRFAEISATARRTQVITGARKLQIQGGATGTERAKTLAALQAAGITVMDPDDE